MASSSLDPVRLRDDLNRRRSELVERVRQVAEDLHRPEPLPSDFEEQAVAVENDPTLLAVGSESQWEIAAIDSALERLAHERYGICEKCGGEIDARRLSVVPHASTCIACART